MRYFYKFSFSRGIIREIKKRGLNSVKVMLLSRLFEKAVPLEKAAKIVNLGVTNTRFVKKTLWGNHKTTVSIQRFCIDHNIVTPDDYLLMI